MDPAESQGPPSNVERILSELTNQATTIQHHDRILTEILQRLNSLVLPQNPPSQEVLELPTPPPSFLNHNPFQRFLFLSPGYHLLRDMMETPGAVVALSPNAL